MPEKFISPERPPEGLDRARAVKRVKLARFLQSDTQSSLPTA